jgi:hypothetical protein
MSSGNRLGILLGCLMTGSVSLGVQPVVAQTLPIANYDAATYQTIGRDTAIAGSVKLQVAPGRMTTIQFQSDEIMTTVIIADPSRMVYTASAELGSPQAKSLFLRRIEQLAFPGATTTWVTNLMVQTVDPAGQQRLYNFDITPVSETPQFVGVTIVPAIAGQQTLRMTNDRTASIRDIEEGLQTAIRKGYTAEDDAIVAGVQQMVTIARGENVTLADAALRANVPLEIVAELAAIAFEERLAPSYAPVSPVMLRHETIEGDVLQEVSHD